MRKLEPDFQFQLDEAGEGGTRTAELEWVAMTHQVLLDRIPGVPDVQAAGLLLLHNAQATANTVANDCVSQLAG